MQTITLPVGKVRPDYKKTNIRFRKVINPYQAPQKPCRFSLESWKGIQHFHGIYLVPWATGNPDVDKELQVTFFPEWNSVAPILQYMLGYDNGFDVQWFKNNQLQTNFDLRLQLPE